MILYNLPKRQREVLSFIINNIEKKKESPTVHEISDGLNLAMGQIQALLDVLEIKNRIKRDRGKHRSITLVE